MAVKSKEISWKSRVPNPLGKEITIERHEAEDGKVYWTREINAPTLLKPSGRWREDYIEVSGEGRITRAVTRVNRGGDSKINVKSHDDKPDNWRTRCLLTAIEQDFIIKSASRGE